MTSGTHHHVGFRSVPMSLSRAALLGALLGVVTACGVSTEDGGSSRGEGEKAPSSAKSADAPKSAQDLGEPVATRTSTDDNFDLTLKVYPVRRDGDLAVVDFSVGARTKNPSDDRYQVADLLSDGNYDASDKEGHAVDGVKMIDGTNRKVHLVASDTDGNCLCSRGLSATFIDSGSSVTFNATFAAPAEDADEVTLSFPSFGTVTGVPVE